MEESPIVSTKISYKLINDDVFESDIFVYTGKFMEPWAEDIINGVTNKDVKFVNTS